MADAMSVTKGACPRYRIKACPSEEKAEEWINARAAEGYCFLDMEAVSSTQHFSKEIESIVWIVMELREDAR
jgi:hypothetical protein